MVEQQITLSLLPETLAVCRLDPHAEIPAWALPGDFVSITRTMVELSIVCPERRVPEEIGREGGWRALKVEGPLDFTLTGILASLAGPLAQAAIPVFAISTYETDYLLVKQTNLDRAVQVLSLRGHQISLHLHADGQVDVPNARLTEEGEGHITARTDERGRHQD
jgi:hypothetical protein